MRRRKEARTANSTFAVGEVSCYEDGFVGKEGAVLHINNCSENLAHLKFAKNVSKHLRDTK